MRGRGVPCLHQKHIMPGHKIVCNILLHKGRLRQGPGQGQQLVCHRGSKGTARHRLPGLIQGAHNVVQPGPPAPFGAHKVDANAHHHIVQPARFHIRHGLC